MKAGEYVVGRGLIASVQWVAAAFRAGALPLRQSDNTARYEAALEQLDHAGLARMRFQMGDKSRPDAFALQRGLDEQSG